MFVIKSLYDECIRFTLVIIVIVAVSAISCRFIPFVSLAASSMYRHRSTYVSYFDLLFALIIILIDVRRSTCTTNGYLIRY